MADPEKMVRLQVTLSGPLAVEVRRIANNLGIERAVFIRRAVKNELKRLGVEVE